MTEPVHQNPLAAVYTIRVDVRGHSGIYTASVSLIDLAQNLPIQSGTGSHLSSTPEGAVKVALSNLIKQLE